MKKTTNLFLLIILAIVLFSSNAIAAPEKTPFGLKVVDVLLVRPACVGIASASTSLYLAIAPAVFLMGYAEPLCRVMVEAPWRFTGSRYLGEFNHYRDERAITVIEE